ncbi:MAG TPA: FAD-dependent oxidoreductase [Saprospiraceae bacterium]|nr:FAD-dependent oxidoreductase [Saprospiraceae bacterium]
MHILIIGNGIAGITAARHIRQRSDHQITVISAESDYFFSRTALMYVYMGHMRWNDIMPYETWFWKKNRIHLINDRVTTLNVHHKTVNTAGGHQLEYDKLILATGSTSNRLDIPGIELDGVASLYSLQDLQYIESKSINLRKAVIAGGGLIGVELAEMFYSRHIPVTFLVRESSYSNMVLPVEESEMVNLEIRNHGIDLRFDSEIKELDGDETGRIKSVITTSGEEIDCQLACIAVGVRPNVSWLFDSPIEINIGILVNEFLQTNIPGIYAVGDCAELRSPSPGRRAIEPLWYTGRLMGEAVASTVCGTPVKYDGGIWFNSAKFFNIEYQVYGDIKPTLPAGEKTVYWQHPDGKKSIRINFTEQGVIGFNLMGIRFRQAVCEKWIITNTNIETVLTNLELALFDQEFSPNYALHVRDAYRSLTGITIKPGLSRKYNHVHAFLNDRQKSHI